ncbi:MAG: hypothetical protein ACXIU8_13155 [Alkalilacustris sp.]
MSLDVLSGKSDLDGIDVLRMRGGAAPRGVFPLGVPPSIGLLEKANEWLMRFCHVVVAGSLHPVIRVVERYSPLWGESWAIVDEAGEAVRLLSAAAASRPKADREGWLGGGAEAMALRIHNHLSVDRASIRFWAHSHGVDLAVVHRRPHEEFSRNGVSHISEGYEALQSFRVHDLAAVKASMMCLASPRSWHRDPDRTPGM